MQDLPYVEIAELFDRDPEDVLKMGQDTGRLMLAKLRKNLTSFLVIGMR